MKITFSCPPQSLDGKSPEAEREVFGRTRNKPVLLKDFPRHNRAHVLHSLNVGIKDCIFYFIIYCLFFNIFYLSVFDSLNVGTYLLPRLKKMFLLLFIYVNVYIFLRFPQVHPHSWAVLSRNTSREEESEVGRTNR